MSLAKVLILYNEPTLPEDHPDAVSEHEILYTADAVGNILTAAGYQVTRLGVNYDPAALAAGLRQHRPDVVFNLFEGTADHGHTEAYAAGVLHWLGIPFTGSPFETLCLARNKHWTKYLLRGAGLPTAEFFVADGPDVPPCPLEWPVIVKPALQDASVGVDQRSVVTDQKALRERVAYLLANYGPPVLVEQFILGREFTVAVIEAPDLRPLPVSEIVFLKTPGLWPIVTFDAKWKPGSDDYEATPPKYPAEISPRLGEKLVGLALKAFRLLGCRDYARVDFRVRPTGKPYILEVNPNPDFSPDAGLAGGLGAAGLTHAQFTVQLVQNALKRGGGLPSPDCVR
jgi:D-alanine-D-alanine ligase